jgi:hypothetical protein
MKMINSFWAKEICTYSFSMGSGKTIAKKIGWEIVKKEKPVGRMEVEDKRKKTRNKRLKGKHN